MKTNPMFKDFEYWVAISLLIAVGFFIDHILGWVVLDLAMLLSILMAMKILNFKGLNQK